MIKKIVHRQRKPLFVYKKEDPSPYGPRIKSAPPIEISFDLPVKSEPKAVIRFTRADGTPLTTEDLVDTSDSDASDSETSSESCSSSSAEQETADVRASMLNDLLKRFSEQKIAPRRLCYSVDEILQVRERTEIPLDLKIRKKREESKGSYRADKNRKDTCIEQARLEFNRLAAKNLTLVIKNLKAVRVGTIAEMKEVAEILFNKATSEPTFVRHYALLVLDLKKGWQSEEEKSKDVNQTVFFGTLLTLTLRTLENKEKWGDEQERRGEMTFEERMTYEQELEEAETERYIKKRRTLGTIDFLSALYSLNVISYVHINACIGALMTADDAEGVEVLCYLVENIGEKLVVSGKEHVISAVCTSLAPKKDRYAARIRYMIEGLLEKRNTWKSKENKTENMFSCLEIENDEEAVEESADRQGILAFLSSLFEELSMAYEDEDRRLLADNLSVGETKFGAVPFYSTYFQEGVSNYKISDALFDFFVQFRADAGISEELLRDILFGVKMELDVLKMDFPISPKKYAELITKLRVADAIPASLFEELKTPDYEARAADLLSRWYHSEDREKALLVLPSERIEALVKK